MWLAITEWIFSNFDVTTFLSFTIFISISLHLFSNNRRKNLPPGPINLPVVGFVPFVVGKNLEKVFLDLIKKYGDVVFFKLGAMPVVILNSYESIKECLNQNSDTAVSRPAKFSVINYVFQDKGIIVENGKIWQDHRRFIMATLRDLGFGKESLECQIRSEALNLLEEFQSYCGQSVDPQNLLKAASANIISALIFGVRYKYNDPQFLDLMRVFESLTSSGNPMHILNSFPFLRFILPEFLSGMKELNSLRAEFHEFAQIKIQEHETNTNHIRDYSEIYLTKQKLDEDNGILNTSFNSDRLRSNTLALISAGTATTSSSMAWVLKILMKFPEIQKRIQEEIDAVIGSERVPSYSDKQNMPYMEAFLLECQRYPTLVPFGVPHATPIDTKISGYDIPAGATIMPMVFMIHNDPNIWGDPENFRPERFLDDEGKLKKSDYLMPFGIGKRSCPGENLAKTEIFIFITNLLQHFTFSAPSKKDLEMEALGNRITRDPLPFKVNVQQRIK